MTLFNYHNLPKDPISKQSHIEGWGSNIWILEKHNSVENRSTFQKEVSFKVTS